jgi:indolepyruvate ferredoxin oxidoreductase beta subunit
VRTTTVSGFLRLRMLTWLKPLRPVSWRAHEEHARMERWLAAVERTAALDERLAAEVAALAQLVKGYGDVRRRLVALFEAALEVVMRTAETEALGGAGAAVSTALAARLRALVLEGPDGESRAEALAAAVRARLDAGDLAGAGSLLAA